MKNNFIKIVLILSFVFNFYYHVSADEFNFEVTEIEIYQNGNLIKGLNGGTVTTDNNIEIIADNFEYNKITSLLEANGNVKLFDKNENITINSDVLFYLKNKEEIYTKGKSKAVNASSIEIDADDYFKYNKLTSLLEAKGNVIINDKENNMIIKSNEAYYLKNKNKFFTSGATQVFVQKKYKLDTSDLIFLRNQKILSSIEKSILKDLALNNLYKLNEFKYLVNKEILKGKNIEVITNVQEPDSDKYFFDNGFFNLKENKFLAKDIKIEFHKTMFEDVENDPRIKATSVYGEEFNTYFEKGIFTTCKKNDKCPPWQIRSNKIRHDKKGKKIIYKDAWLEIYDFPVVYFPKFFHPDPSVKRQSGFLKPELGSSKTLGNSTYIPYFYVISDDKDITIKPRIFSYEKFVLQSEYRQKTKKSYTIADFSFAKGHNSSIIDKNDNRSHFFSNTKIDLNLNNFLTSNLEIKIEKVSNDNYLKLFNFESPLLFENDIDVLDTKIKLDLAHEDFDLTGSFEQYETLSGLNSDRYQYVLPNFNFSKNFYLENMNGILAYNSNGNNTLNDTNVLSTVLINDLNYNSYDMYYENGIKSNYAVLVKNLNTMGKNNIKYKTSPQSEVMSSYMFNASIPLIKNSNQSFNTLEPKLSLRFSPHEMKNNNTLERRIDITNVFNINRLSMSDSFEGGQSLTLGFDYKKEKINSQKDISEIEDYFEFNLATVLRNNVEEKIPSKSTLNKKNSNIFGKLSYKPLEFITVKYDFSLKNDLNTFEYNSLDTLIEFDNFSTRFNFLEERGALGNTNVVENTTKYSFDDKNSIEFKTRENRNLNLTEYYDLIYEYKNDCLVAGVQYKKKYYNDADIKPVEELFFSITIIPLTTFSPDKMILSGKN